MPNFLTEAEKKEIADCIAVAERNTTGEIRIFLEKHCKEDPAKHAVKIFQGLKMTKTLFHTGVLIYVAHVDHALAIVGDQGINEKVPPAFWDDVKEELLLHFREGKYTVGLKNAITQCGYHLKKHFPTDSDNPNELSNEVVIGNE
jgi:uncharacterized membrane protein